MEPPPGTVVLRPRRSTVWFIALSAAFLGFVTVEGARTLDGAPAYAVPAVCGALTLLCLFGLWLAPRMAFHVSPYDVALLHGDRERVRLRYQDLTEVRLALTRHRRITAHTVNAFTLTGTTPDGAVRQLRIALTMVPTLDPLYDALAPVVAARPELVRDQATRDLFAGRSTAL